MKLIKLLMLTVLLHFAGTAFGQNVTLNEGGIPIQKLLEKIEQQTGYTFFYNNRFFSDYPKVRISVSNVSLKDALSKIFSSGDLNFSIVKKTVVISKKEADDRSPQVEFSPKAIRGKVIDKHGAPLVNVTISTKGGGTGQAWVSDKNGNFTAYPRKANDIFVFSFIGFQSREVSAESGELPKVVLSEFVSVLDLVQITAYGTTTNRESTGNFTAISASEIAKSPSRNVLEILQGQVSGLFVQQYSGNSGSPFNLMIRGQQSLSGGYRSSQPLIIVDGVALPGGKLPIFQITGSNEGLNSILQGGSPLDYLDPSTIELITILKDADATSIYGSRGAYGVILINTKKARPGQPKVSFNGSTGISIKGISPHLLNTEQYIMIRKEAYKNDDTPITFSSEFEDINGIFPADRFTNWQKLFYGYIGTINKANVAYSGGSEDLNFLVSANYRKQGSIQIGKGGVEDGGVNFNINNKTNDNKFSLSLIGSILTTKDDALPFDFSASDAIVRAPNNLPLFNTDGSLNWEVSANPAAAKNLIYDNTTNTLRSALILKYEPIEGLTFNTTMAYNHMSSKQIRAQASTYYDPSTLYLTTSTITQYSIRNITFEPNIAYVRKLGDMGILTAKLGATLQDHLSEHTNITGYGFISDDLVYNPSYAGTQSDGTGNVTFYDHNPNKYVGVFAILNYNLAGKYFLNLNGRRDGSTKFGENHRFGNFGSVGTAWVLSKEFWFQSLLPALSFAKIRGSLGTSGGDGIENYGYLATYSKGTPYQGSEALKADNLANKDLHWEQNTKAELGMTLEFFSGRINFDGVYYNSSTTDQLVPQLLPSVTGFNYQLTNSPAVIRNWGYEFELNTRNVSTRNFSWSSRINITLPNNRLLAFPDIEKVGESTSYLIGQSVEGIRLFNYAGVDPQTGLYNFINRNGVKGSYLQVLDPVALDRNLDRTEFIDLTPKYYGGFANSLTYKGFSLDLFFTFTNRMGRSYLGSEDFPAGFPDFNPSMAALDRWQKPGDIASVQRAGASLPTLFSQNNFQKSTGAYERATYIRLSTLNFSYTFSQDLIKPFHLKGLSIFLQGSNLLTISKYKDFDPENLGVGMPPLRMFTGGLNLTL